MAGLDVSALIHHLFIYDCVCYIFCMKLECLQHWKVRSASAVDIRHCCSDSFNVATVCLYSSGKLEII